MLKVPHSWQCPSPPPVPPQGAPGGSGAARCSQGEAQPLGPRPRPRGLERAACKGAASTAFDPPQQQTLSCSSWPPPSPISPPLTTQSWPRNQDWVAQPVQDASTGSWAHDAEEEGEEEGALAAEFGGFGGFCGFGGSTELEE